MENIEIEDDIKIIEGEIIDKKADTTSKSEDDEISMMLKAVRNNIKSRDSLKEMRRLEIEKLESEKKLDMINQGILKVYRKKATHAGASEDDYYYNATRSDGRFLQIKFKGAASNYIPDEKVFMIKNIKGSIKYLNNEYDVIRYYITSFEKVYNYYNDDSKIDNLEV